MVALVCAAGAQAQLDEDCTVSVNGQTVNVNPDGSFQLNNIPAGTNLVRILAVCEQPGIVLYGVSEFFEVAAGQTYNVNNIALSPFPPLTLAAR